MYVFITLFRDFSYADRLFSPQKTNIIHSFHYVPFGDSLKIVGKNIELPISISQRDQLEYWTRQKRRKKLVIATRIAFEASAVTISNIFFQL